MKLEYMIFGLAVFALLTGVAFADEANETGRGISLNARHEHAVCRISYAIGTIDAYTACASSNNVTIDLSEYRTRLQNDVVTLKNAANAKDKKAFREALQKTLEDMKDSAKAIRESGRDIKGKDRRTLNQCIREKRAELNSSFAECQRNALKAAKEETVGYYEDHLDKLQGSVDKLGKKNVSRQNLQSDIDSLKSLKERLSSAFDSGDASTVHGVRLQFNRIAANFWIDHSKDVLDYVSSAVANSSNTNKDQIISKINGIKAELTSLKTSCPISSDTSDQGAYSSQNKECWDKLRTIHKEFGGIKDLIKSGRPQKAANETER